MRQALAPHATRWLADAQALAAEIPDGALLALPPDYSLVPMEVVRALVRRRARALRLLGVPVLGLAADLLIGAGCVAEVDTSAVSLGEAGEAPRFRAAVEEGRLRVRDSTCPMVHTALQAAEKGVPFMPLRGVIGSELVARREDWRVIANPFAEGDDPILVARAIVPDVALFHARWADAEGNVWVGRRRELATMAHASARALVSVEERHPGNLLADELLAPGTIASVYVAAVAVVPRGAWPLGLPGCYGCDDAHIAHYARAALSGEGFARYVEEFVRAPVPAA